MNRWILFGLLIGSTIAIAFPVYHYRHALNQPLIGNYLFAGLIIEGIILFLIQNHTDTKRRDEDRKEKHTLNLNEKILRTLIDVQPELEPRLHKLVLKVPRKPEVYRAMKKDAFLPFDEEELLFVPLQTLPKTLYDWALKHIESYGEINKPWKDAQDLVKKYNNSSETFVQSLKDVIVKEIEIKFSGFRPVDPQSKLSNDDFYDLSDIQRIMYYAFRKHGDTDKEPTFSDLEIEQDGDIKYVIIGSQNIRIIQSTKEISVDSVRELLLSIYNNQDLQQQFCKLKEIHQQAREKTQEFGKNLAILVSELDEGALIKGKCKLGY